MYQIWSRNSITREIFFVCITNLTSSKSYEQPTTKVKENTEAQILKYRPLRNSTLDFLPIGQHGSNISYLIELFRPILSDFGVGETLNPNWHRTKQRKPSIELSESNSAYRSKEPSSYQRVQPRNPDKRNIARLA